MINVASYAKTKSSGNGGTGGGSYSSTINYYGKLSPHYLWGNLFDGSQDITGDIDASQADITAKNVTVKNELDAKTLLAFRNLANCYVIDASEVNAYLVSVYSAVIAEKSALQSIVKEG